jgi:hypothetical protein
MGAHIK